MQDAAAKGRRRRTSGTGPHERPWNEGRRSRSGQRQRAGYYGNKDVFLHGFPLRSFALGMSEARAITRRRGSVLPAENVAITARISAGWLSGCVGAALPACDSRRVVTPRTTNTADSGGLANRRPSFPVYAGSSNPNNPVICRKEPSVRPIRDTNIPANQEFFSHEWTTRRSPCVITRARLRRDFAAGPQNA